eukprot:sb/3469177/
MIRGSSLADSMRRYGMWNMIREAHQIYKVGHGFLVRVSEVWRENGDSCENKNYGRTLDQFLGNFFNICFQKIRKFIFHSFIHLPVICDMSILIFHHYATFLWLKFIFPMSTIKTKLKHLVTWQLRKCTCMILALPATFNELYRGYILSNLFQSLGEHWISKDLCSQEKSRSKLEIFAYPMFSQTLKKIEQKVAAIQFTESRRKGQNHACAFSQLYWCFNFVFMVLLGKINSTQKKVA